MEGFKYYFSCLGVSFLAGYLTDIVWPSAATAAAVIAFFVSLAVFGDS